eukprot:NODE_12933_length_268_cov_19.105023_g12020_i0.p2 GENE.NODE_12933_length_268_cov_19.105023_g12020_i0~~NODE_12933_length_268_cov_19.105023_g12020_i0.p2  ORF type:complete len:67 (+),score=27.97 NODE_12933_length_268_cov_19.105023_g12020_i0:27-203(+)
MGELKFDSRIDSPDMSSADLAVKKMVPMAEDITPALVSVDDPIINLFGSNCPFGKKKK